MIKYCESIYKTKRWKTRQVLVGNIGVGGNNPIRIQSMTTSNTRDVETTVDQIMRLSDAGCEIARVTVQGMKEADACEGIKNGLLIKGYTIPLVADIHFFPPAAMRVVDFVDKVRINPGNYIDKRASFKTIDYDDISYEKEIEKIEEKFTPLVEKCKRLKRSMRIGTNHGSLSDRIMNRYGDTPNGMVESALEFARVCRKNDYHDFMFSMKSSNPQVMILAYRLLVAEMMTLGWDYPLHLGVTEAGEGEDGRIKSAMGIGSLLLDGIGDTIRVSLTEDAWNEIDPCKRLVALANSYEGTGIDLFEETHRKIEAIERRKPIFPKKLSFHRDGSVFLSASPDDLKAPNFAAKLGCDVQLGLPKLKNTSADCLVLNEKPEDPKSIQTLKNLQEMGMSIFSKDPLEGHLPRDWARDLAEINNPFSAERGKARSKRSDMNEEGMAKPCPTKKIDLAKPQPAENGLFISAQSPIWTLDKFTTHSQMSRFSVTPSQCLSAVMIRNESPEKWSILETIQPSAIFLSPTSHRLHYSRQFFDWLQKKKITIPVVLHFSYECSKEDLIIQAAAEYGALFCDGLGDGIWIDALYDIDFLRTLSFNILQSARMRTSKTDFISCPSCGRTLFDLQDVSKRIRSRTSHLPGVKIAIMGCIVNGPGEMADADFGYVGSKPGMIDLYVGKECVEKNIPFAEADDRLIDLLKQHGRWKEPELETCKSIA